MDRISKQPEIMKEIARRALTWVVTARTPLFREEFAMVIAIDHTTTRIQELETQYMPQVGIDACCGLLSIEGRSVRLIHFTVQEFLKGPGGRPRNEIEDNTELARSSIRYMLCEGHGHEVGFKPTGMQGGARFNETDYVWRFWDQHIRSLPFSLNDELVALIYSLLDSDGRQAAYVARARVYTMGTENYNFFAFFDLLLLYNELFPFDTTVLGSFDQICNAARGGAMSALISLLEIADKRGAQDCYSRPLFLAAYCGHEDIVRHLVSRGVNVNVTGYTIKINENSEDSLRSTGDTALQIAAYKHNQVIVEILLEHGADVNLQSGDYGNPLQVAAYSGDKAVVETLLQHGADVNLQGGKHGTALNAAAGAGNKAIVEILLKGGAEKSLVGGDYGTALHAAAYSGQEEIFDLFLTPDVNVNRRAGSFETVLQCAARGGKEAIVNTLLKRGADVNHRGGYFGTALHATAYQYNDIIVEILLAHGADANANAGGF